MDRKRRIYKRLAFVAGAIALAAAAIYAWYRGASRPIEAYQRLQSKSQSEIESVFAEREQAALKIEIGHAPSAEEIISDVAEAIDSSIVNRREAAGRQIANFQSAIERSPEAVAESLKWSLFDGGPNNWPDGIGRWLLGGYTRFLPEQRLIEETSWLIVYENGFHSSQRSGPIRVEGYTTTRPLNAQINFDPESLYQLLSLYRQVRIDEADERDQWSFKPGRVPFVEYLLLNERFDLSGSPPVTSDSEKLTPFLNPQLALYVRVAILNALNEGDVEKASALFLRYVELLRYVHVCTYPAGRTPSHEIQLNLAGGIYAAAGDGGWLSDEVLVKAGELVERARFSEAEIEKLWPAVALRIEEEAYRYFETRWRPSAEDDPKKIVTRLMFPVIRRSGEKLALAYAESEDRRAKRIRFRERIYLKIAGLPDDHLARIDHHFAPPGNPPETGYEGIKSGELYLRLIDEAHLVIGYLRYRASTGANPRDIDSLLPFIHENARPRFEKVRLELVESRVVPDDQIRDGFAANTPAWKFYKAKEAFSVQHRKVPLDPEDIRPFIKSESDWQAIQKYLNRIPETPIFIRTDGQTGPLASWPVPGWSNEELLDFYWPGLN